MTRTNEKTLFWSRANFDDASAAKNRNRFYPLIRVGRIALLSTIL
jgi:hypothetical protein